MRSYLAYWQNFENLLCLLAEFVLFQLAIVIKCLLKTESITIAINGKRQPQPIPLKTSGRLVVYLPEKADACSPAPAQPGKIEKGGAGWH
jgi:hypothetical protein